MIDWKGRTGTYCIAPPYTLVVPAAYPEAVNINAPEYSWARGLIVALRSLHYAYNNTSACEPIPLVVAAKQLDTVRRARKLLMIPPSDYYMANCHTLHAEYVSGPTAVSRWKRYVSGQPLRAIEEYPHCWGLWYRDLRQEWEAASVHRDGSPTALRLLEHS